MLRTRQTPTYVDTAVDAITNQPDWQPILDGLPVPTYVTDPDGLVTYSNSACADFAGRKPEPGRDRWCVTWKMYTPHGEPLPHESCPMAEAVQGKKAVHGKIAIALRPDGGRRAFQAYPTPVLDADGNVTAAVNLLLDVTEEQASALTDQASRCRRLARATHDPQAAQILGTMADGYQQTAIALQANGRALG